MALTISPTQIDGASVPRVEGNRKTITVKVTFDASYVNTGTYNTSGYALTASQFGLNTLIEWFDVAPTNAGHIVVWDATTNRLHVFTAQGSEVGNGTNLSTFFCFAQVYGE